MRDDSEQPSRLAGEDLTFWWYDSPKQPTTMAMLVVLDREPDERRLRAAIARAVAAVPRMRQRVVDAPFDLTVPRWTPDPTFDLDYHIRRHGLSGSRDLAELFREIVPAYETPFDRSRPLWEARYYDGMRDGSAALFFKLHHAVADGIGGNAIFGAMTDADATCADDAAWEDLVPQKGPWPATPPLLTRVTAALRDRAGLVMEQAQATARTLADVVSDPSRLRTAWAAMQSIVTSLTFDSGSPLRQRDAFGRSRRMTGIALPFATVREIRHALHGSMIDVILTIMAQAMGAWHREAGMEAVRDLLTLVPVNLRRPEEWTQQVATGNVATGLLIPLPIDRLDPLATFAEVHRRVEEKKSDPAQHALPMIVDVLSAFGRGAISLLGESSFSNLDFIVTNVPGILVPRYLGGAEITAAYPFAPVSMSSPASIALYGYRDRLFIGIDVDETVMTDVDGYAGLIRAAFEELAAAAGVVAEEDAAAA